MATVLRVILFIVAGFKVGFLAGIGLVELLSMSSHDKGQELAMTAFFVIGPIGAVFGFLQVVFGRPKPFK